MANAGRTTSKYDNSSSGNFFNRHQASHSEGNSYLRSSSSQRPRRSYYQFGGSGAEDSEKDDEKLLSLSDRIKKLSSSKVLRDSSTLTHNNNEPFTYLKEPKRIASEVDNGKNTNTRFPLNHQNKREVIYAQVVVDEGKNPNINDIRTRSHAKNKRTVHRLYNNNNYTEPSRTNSRGKNVTTVLLNSSGDDTSSSLNTDGLASNRFQRRSSPTFLADVGSFYPRSPGMVLKQHASQNKNNGQKNNKDIENRYKSTYMESDDDDDYFESFKAPYPQTNLYTGFDQNKPGEDENYVDEFDNYQPVLFKNRGISDTITTNQFTDNYNVEKPSRGGREIGYDFVPTNADDDDEYKINDHFLAGMRKSRTLERGTSFKNHFRSLDLNRSRTLDDRISAKNGNKSGNQEFEQEKDLFAKESPVNLSQRPNKTRVSSKSKSGNIFSTFLRRNQNKKVERIEKDIPFVQPEDINQLDGIKSRKDEKLFFGGGKTKIESAPKKSTQSTNFFTLFLDKKRKKQTNLELKKSQAQQEDITSNTYQSYNAWPPSVTVVDYSSVDQPLLLKDAVSYDNIVDYNTEDSNNNSSDIWKKSYGSDFKVKRRWTMREPPPTDNPSVTKEEESFMRTRGPDPRKEYLPAPNTQASGHYSLNRRNKFKSHFQEVDEDPDLNKFMFVGDDDTASKLSRNKFNTIGGHSAAGKMYNSMKINENLHSSTAAKAAMSSKTDKKQRKGYSNNGRLTRTPNSSGSETSARNNGLNDSLRSVYLHEAAVIPEMPKSTGNSTGGASASGLSGRRTLSKDEISNSSSARKEQKQLSRSMSVVARWGPQRQRDRYEEVDYSRNNTLHLPPRPPSRSPSATGYYPQSQQGTKGQSPNRSHKLSNVSAIKAKHQIMRVGQNPKKSVVSSSVESLLKYDTPEPIKPSFNKGGSKLGRSKSIGGPSSMAGDSKNKRFSTFWFNKKNNK